jgi:2-desacetyl-2-hydroxyethyl bacteriochlorophyllide A dehydrogenase
MMAVMLRGPRHVEVVDQPGPSLLDPRDAVVRVAQSAICGTDLHPYRGELEGFRRDTVLGHEFVGVIESVGPATAGLKPGQRVVASCVIACGRCWWCDRAEHYHCPQVSLFGYGEVVGSYVPGGQAELVRVPFADTVLHHIPDHIDDEQAVFVGDVLATGWSAAIDGGVGEGDTVAIVGCGPVGLCAALSSRAQGAETIVAVETSPARRAVAERLGAVSVAPSEAAQAVGDLSGARGADVVIEAVGSDAALAAALSLVRPRGVVVAVGAHHSAAFPLPTGEAFAKELTLRFCVGDSIRHRDRLLSLIASGRLDTGPLVSHRLPLAAAPEAYALFDQQEATKVLLAPPKEI